MLRKLRIQFVALIMGIVAALLTAVCVTVCVLDYHQGVAVATEALDRAIRYAADDGRTPPERQPHPAEAPRGDEAPLAAPAEASPNGEQPAEAQSADAAPPQIGGREPEPSIPVAVYRQAPGSQALVPTRATASLSDETLGEAARAIADAAEGTGTLAPLGLFYEKRLVRGDAYVAFVDASTVNGWQRLALALGGLELVALGVLLMASIAFSRWALAPVEHAWRQQKRFVADVSHDLKTPLTVVLANASIMLEEPDRTVASQRQWVEGIKEEAESMQSMVNDMLVLARLDEAEEKPAPGKGHAKDAAPGEGAPSCDLARIATAELLQFESVAYERGLTLTGSIADGTRVRAPEEGMRRLLQILLDNACKYADEGGSVTVDLHGAGRTAVLAVSNTGSVIPPDQIEAIFDRFYRADDARTSHEGHGLGLAIARSTLHECGGAIAATSTPDGLTTFTAHIPLA